MRKNFRVI